MLLIWWRRSTTVPFHHFNYVGSLTIPGVKLGIASASKVNFMKIACVSCSFEKFGAPLITLTDILETDEKGNLFYDKCHEVVLWEKGINVWDIFVEDEQIKVKKLLSDDFSLSTNTKHELYLELMDKCVKVSVGEETFTLRIDNLPEKVYIGITGCENKNRFYNVKIETAE